MSGEVAREQLGKETGDGDTISEAYGSPSFTSLFLVTLCHIDWFPGVLGHFTQRVQPKTRNWSLTDATA